MAAWRSRLNLAVSPVSPAPTRGRWHNPAPRTAASEAPRGSAVLIGVLGLLLVLGLGKLAGDTIGVSAAPLDKGLGAAADGDPCALYGLVSVGESGLCSHGIDPAPPGLSVDARVQPELRASQSPAAVACEGDGEAGKRIEVIYARPSDRPDRYAEYLPSFRQWSADADTIFRTSAAATGGSRSLRFQTSTPSGGSCSVVVRRETLSSTVDDVAWSSFNQMITELRAKGYTATDRKYLIFMDSNIMCGIGSFLYDNRRDGGNVNNSGPSYARVDTGCWGGLIAAHELGHNMGAVQFSSPNSSLGAHCVDEWDVMCYSDYPYYPAMRFECLPDTSFQYLLDCHNDDYFHTNPAPGSYLDRYFNLAFSPFLIGAFDRGAAPRPPVPSNDSVGSAVRASARPFTELREVGRATAPTSDPASTCDGDTSAGRLGSVWYRTTPGAGGRITVDTAGSDYDTVVSVYRGSPGSLTQVTCNDDIIVNNPAQTQYQAEASFTATAGTTYHIMVTGWPATPPSLLRIRITGVSEAPAPTLSLSKEASRYNGVVVATMSNLTPNSAVTVRWEREFEITSGRRTGEFTSLLASGTAAGDGTLRLSFTTPLEAFGDYTVTARDVAGGRATATLRVIPRILLNEVSGPTTTRLRVYFYGFGAGERVEVRWHRDGSATSTYAVVTTITAQANGRATSLVTIPRAASIGEHRIVGKVIGASRSASTTFSVTATALEATATPTGTPTTTPTATTEPTPTGEASPVPIETETATPTPTEVATVTAEPTATETATVEPTATATATPEPTSPPDPTATPVPEDGPPPDGA